MSIVRCLQNQTVQAKKLINIIAPMVHFDRQQKTAHFWTVCKAKPLGKGY